MGNNIYIELQAKDRKQRNKLEKRINELKSCYEIIGDGTAIATYVGVTMDVTNIVPSKNSKITSLEHKKDTRYAKLDFSSSLGVNLRIGKYCYCITNIHKPKK